MRSQYLHGNYDYLQVLFSHPINPKTNPIVYPETASYQSLAAGPTEVISL